MRKLSIIGISILSLLLVQCYSQYEYIVKDYEPKQAEELVEIVLKDGTKKNYNEGKYQFVIKPDSLMIVYNVDYTKQNLTSFNFYAPDTINVDLIKSFKVIANNPALSFLAVIFGGMVAIYLGIIVVMLIFDPKIM